MRCGRRWFDRDTRAAATAGRRARQRIGRGRPRQRRRDAGRHARCRAAHRRCGRCPIAGHRFDDRWHDAGDRHERPEARCPAAHRVRRGPGLVAAAPGAQSHTAHGDPDRGRTRARRHFPPRCARAARGERGVGDRRLSIRSFLCIRELGAIDVRLRLDAGKSLPARRWSLRASERRTHGGRRAQTHAGYRHRRHRPQAQRSSATTSGCSPIGCAWQPRSGRRRRRSSRRWSAWSPRWAPSTASPSAFPASCATVGC